VPGGTFFLSYDGVTANHTLQSNQASVSTFDLDVFAVTVGRFRKFVAAVGGGFTPAANSGKHTHLNGGKGLINSASAGTYEAGWDTSWNAKLPMMASAWNTALQCNPTFATWTATPGSKERLPITCVNWYQAYAFCIWDGGFLPSEAEWNFAASGGSNQRVYPWSSPSKSQTIDCTYANYLGASAGTDFCFMPGVGGQNAVGSEQPTGDGAWNHTDLSGNVFQWTLDANAAYAATCADCANLTAGGDAAAGATRSIRGGSFNSGPAELLAAERNSQDPSIQSDNLGLRCARSPYGASTDN
jgi:formylglycine-generating enzyme required for sulfatase activity